MSRSLGALRLPAPPASLALALCTLGSLLLAWAPSTDAAKQPKKQGAAEVLAAPLTPEAEQGAAAAPQPVSAHAKRTPHRSAKQTSENGSPSEAGPSVPTGGGGEGHGAGA